ncbi:MAG: zinc ribbon domain-containing protein [Ktedonobacteraceae bacterium]|nr:zinc ribbon domain-containing protein [Ktedonobacteraceae bacterium]
MDCTSCHQQLPLKAKVCPNCGTPTSAYYEASGTSSEAHTLPSAPSRGMPNSNTPSTLDMNPYRDAVSNPYTSAPPPPPQYATNPPPVSPMSPAKKRVGWNVVASVLALVLIGAGIFIFLSKSGSNAGPLPGQNTSNSSTTSTQSTSTIKLSASTAQKLYDTTISSSPLMNEDLGAPDSYGWDHQAQANTSCTFSGGAYHAQAKPRYFSPCYASATNFSDLLLQVQMTVVSGHSGGVVFRADDTKDYEYQFRISTDGTYILNKYVLEYGKPASKPLLSGSSPAIIKGTNQPNLVAVLAQGNAIAVYVNKKYLAATNDTTYQQGQIGVYVDSDPSPVVDAAFTKLQVWRL